MIKERKKEGVKESDRESKKICIERDWKKVWYQESEREREGYKVREKERESEREKLRKSDTRKILKMINVRTKTKKNWK